MSRLIHPLPYQTGLFPQTTPFSGKDASPRGVLKRFPVAPVQDRFPQADRVRLGQTRFGQQADPAKKPGFFKRHWQKLAQWFRTGRISVTLGLRYGLEAIKMFGGLCLWSLVFIPFPKFMSGTAKRIQQFARNRFLTGPKSVPNPNLIKDPKLKAMILSQEKSKEALFNLKERLEPEADKLKGKLKLDPKADNIDIHAWHIPAPPNRPTVIVNHGRGSNIMHLEPVMQAFRKKNMGVIVYDYPGFGRSGGSPSPESLYKSGLAMSLHAKKKLKVPFEQQIILGNSLGSIVAANTAKALEDLGKPAPKALILVNPLPSLREVFIHMRDRFKLGWLYNEERLKLALEAHKALQGLTHTPVQVMRGKHDKYIPREQVATMYDRIGKPDGASKPAPFYADANKAEKHLELKFLPETHHRLKDKDYPLLADEVERFIQRPDIQALSRK